MFFLATKNITNKSRKSRKTKKKERSAFSSACCQQKVNQPRFCSGCQSLDLVFPLVIVCFRFSKAPSAQLIATWMENFWPACVPFRMCFIFIPVSLTVFAFLAQRQQFVIGKRCVYAILFLQLSAVSLEKLCHEPTLRSEYKLSLTICQGFLTISQELETPVLGKLNADLAAETIFWIW